ncbi:hypothetical protein ADIS_3924 [Lunatimonas lonarensis]|uniref:Uncharacterized protein n=1 Tax=Lunatimonas lonarensis TaxID=1232681 RepID=R7ZN43_9BACT|nr:hypothetical protein [Lunatimonas lonarensis]EON75521.1 hypothetical protein ADIS_3924 [Lunatimonas lonarensis]
MKFRDLRVWLYVFGFAALVAIYLYQQTRSHKRELESQSIKAVVLGKNNLQSAFFNYQQQFAEYLTRNFYSLTTGELAGQAERVVGFFDASPKFLVHEMSWLSEEESLRLQNEALKGRIVQRDSSASMLVENYYFDLAARIANGSDPFYKLSPNLIQRRFGTNGFSIPADGGKDRLAFLVTHEIPIYRLMEDNIPLRFFDRLFLLDEAGVAVYPGSFRGRPLVDPSELVGGIAGSGKAEETVVNAGELAFKMSFGNEEFEAFLSPFSLAGGQYYLLGLKESSQFTRAAYRIDFGVLSVLVLGLVLILVGIPIIGIFTLSQGDVLTKGKVMGIGLSLIFLALVAGYSLAFVQNQRASGFNGLVLNELETRLVEKFGEYTALLHRYADGTPLDSVYFERNERLDVNEFIQFSSDGYIRRLDIPGVAPVDLSDQSFISIKHRDYVVESQRTPEKVFLSAHYSNATGALEGVVSVFGDDTGSAITFDVATMVADDLSKQRFFVFKPDGKVIMKSTGLELPVNFLQDAIDRDVWVEIQTLLQNNQSGSRARTWEMPLYVNGHGYQAVLRRLDFEGFISPVWVMSLVDKSLQDSLFVLATFETLAFLLPYVVVLGLLVAFVFLARLPPIYLRLREFSFDWYRPSPAKRTQYLYANYILASHLLVYLFVYLVIPLTIFSVFAWSAFITVGACICNFLLLFPQAKRGLGSREFNFLAPALFVWLLLAILVILLTYYSLDGGYFFMSLAAMGILVLAIGLCFLATVGGKMPKLKPDFSGELTGLKKLHFHLTNMWNFVTQLQVEKRIYSLNFLLWITIMGFMPGYVIHRQVFTQEYFLWNHPQGAADSGEGIRLLSGVYRDLVGAHEQLRRINFSRLTSRTDIELKRFLAPDIEAVEASFRLPKQVLRRNGEFERSNEVLQIVFRKIGQTPLLLLGTLLLLGLFFNLIMRISKRIYLVDYLFPLQEKRLPAACVHRKFTFVIGLDNKKIEQWIRYHFFSEWDTVLVVSAIDGFEVKEDVGKYRAVLLNNLHCLADTAQVLEVLERFKAAYFHLDVAVFVSSGLSIQDLIRDGASDAEVVRITEIMKPFLFYVVPLNFHQRVLLLPNDGGEWSSMPEEGRQRFRRMVRSPLFNDPMVYGLTEELIYGENSSALACLLTDELGEDSLETRISQDRYEKCILSIQRYNKAFFINVWSKLNMREKKLCYYFALEGFINYTMRDLLASLLQKGVLKLSPSKDRLLLFSRSFSNFVLSNIDERELEAFKLEEKAKGNSRLVQAASISFVFISVSVIGFYDPNILDRSIAYVSGAIGISGTLFSFFQKGFKNIWSGDA